MLMFYSNSVNKTPFFIHQLLLVAVPVREAGSIPPIGIILL
jgi:hypothetical protein